MKTKKEKHYFKDRKQRATKAKVRRKEDKYGVEKTILEYSGSSLR